MMVRALVGRLVAAGLCIASASHVAQAETNQLRIGLQFGLSYLPIMVAQSEGLFAKRAAEFGVPKLDVTLTRFSGSTAMNEALLSNTIDAGVLGIAGALIIWDKTRGRQHFKSIAAVSSTSYTLFSNKPHLKALTDFTSSDKIAVPAFNSPQAILLRVASERMMGDKTKVDPMMVNMPHPDATAGLLAGQGISGYFATPPFSQVLAKDRRITPILTSRELLGGREATSTSMVMSQGFFDDNPMVSKAILAGLEDANALIAANPKRAAAIYLEAERVRLPADEVERLMTDGSTSYSVAPDGVVTYANFMQVQGFVRKVPEAWQDVFFPLIADRPGS